MKHVRLIKMSLNETHMKVRISKNLSDSFPIQNGLKQRHPLLSLLFKFAFGCAIRRKVQESQEGLKLNGTCQFLVYAVHANLLEENTNTMKRNTDALLESSKKVCLEINANKIKYIFMSRKMKIVKCGEVGTFGKDTDKSELLSGRS
jgi:hypothetical protein